MSQTSWPRSPTGAHSNLADRSPPGEQRRESEGKEIPGYFRKNIPPQEKEPRHNVPTNERPVDFRKKTQHVETNSINERNQNLRKLMRGRAMLSVEGEKSSIDSEVLKILAKGPANPYIPLATGIPPRNCHPYVRRSPIRTTGRRPNEDAVLKCIISAKEFEGEPHPNGFSGLTYAVASIVSMSLVRTNGSNPCYNDVSPYLDLAPLYGPNDDDTNAIRLNNGSGKLAPDTFYEDPYEALVTPATAVLLILLNRYHNNIAATLLSKNERGTWCDPSISHDKQKQDNEIFEIARSMTCFQFKDIVMQDFFKGLRGVSPIDEDGYLNIMASNVPGIMELGAPYQSSVESTFLYKWFNFMSREDINFISAALPPVVENKTINEITRQDIRRARGIHPDGDKTRGFFAALCMRRNVDGYFNDAELAKLLHTATEAPAGASGSQSVSSSFQAMQVELVRQSREWGVCTLNEYRKSLGLRPLTSFKEWNSDFAVHRSAEAIYGNIENLELYPGLQGESTPQDGFRLGYTMSFGLSSDLALIVRSDPRFTIDFNEDKLTPWGYKECTDRKGAKGAFGAMLPHVLFRTLPLYYPFASVYTLFPMVLPSQSQKLLKECKSMQNPDLYYDFQRPRSDGEPIIRLQEEVAITEVLSHDDIFASLYATSLREITDGYGYFLGFEGQELGLHDKDHILTMCSLIPDTSTLSRFRLYFRKTLAEILLGHSTTPGIKRIDLVQDVINVLCMRWVCDHLCGSGNFISDTMDTQELQGVFRRLNNAYAFTSGMVDASEAWEVRSEVRQTVKDLKEQIKNKLPPSTDNQPSMVRTYIEFWRKECYKKLEELRHGRKLVRPAAKTFLDRILVLSKVIDIGELIFNVPQLWEMRETIIHHDQPDDPSALSRIQARVDDTIDRKRIVSNVCGLVILASIKLAQVCSLAVSVYLREEYTVERERIIELCQKEAESDLDNTERLLLLGYIQEAQRLHQNLSVVRVATQDYALKTGDSSVNIKEGTRIQVCLTEMHKIINPELDPTREQPSSLQGLGIHKCPALGRLDKGKPGFLDAVLPEVFVSIFNLPAIRGVQTQTVTMNYSQVPSDIRHLYIPTPEIPVSIVAEFTAKPDNGAFAKLLSSCNRLKHLTGRPTAPIPETTGLAEYGILIFIVTILALVLWNVVSLLFGAFASVTWVFLTLFSPVWVALFWVFYSFIFLVFPAIYSLIFPGIRAICSLVFPIWAILSFAFSTTWSSGYSLWQTRIDGPIHIDAATIQRARDWQITSFNLDRANTPIPIQYTFDLTEPLTFAVLDADRRDTWMQIVIDDKPEGTTKNISLDKSVNCNDSAAECIKSHSCGSVVVEKGKHRVAVRYAGMEFLDEQAKTVNWEGETQRRIFWKVIP